MLEYKNTFIKAYQKGTKSPVGSNNRLGYLKSFTNDIGSKGKQSFYHKDAEILRQAIYEYMNASDKDSDVSIKKESIGSISRDRLKIKMFDNNTINQADMEISIKTILDEASLKKGMILNEDGNIRSAFVNKLKEVKGRYNNSNTIVSGNNIPYPLTIEQYKQFIPNGDLNNLSNNIDINSLNNLYRENEYPNIDGSYDLYGKKVENTDNPWMTYAKSPKMTADVLDIGAIALSAFGPASAIAGLVGTGFRAYDDWDNETLTTREKFGRTSANLGFDVLALLPFGRLAKAASKSTDVIQTANRLSRYGSKIKRVANRVLPASMAVGQVSYGGINLAQASREAWQAASNGEFFDNPDYLRNLVMGGFLATQAGKSARTFAPRKINTDGPSLKVQNKYSRAYNKASDFITPGAIKGSDKLKELSAQMGYSNSWTKAGFKQDYIKYLNQQFNGNKKQVSKALKEAGIDESFKSLEDFAVKIHMLGNKKGGIREDAIFGSHVNILGQKQYAPNVITENYNIFKGKLNTKAPLPDVGGLNKKELSYSPTRTFDIHKMKNEVPGIEGKDFSLVPENIKVLKNTREVTDAFPYNVRPVVGRGMNKKTHHVDPISGRIVETAKDAKDYVKKASGNKKYIDSTIRMKSIARNNKGYTPYGLYTDMNQSEEQKFDTSYKFDYEISNAKFMKYSPNSRANIEKGYSESTHKRVVKKGNNYYIGYIANDGGEVNKYNYFVASKNDPKIKSIIGDTKVYEAKDGFNPKDQGIVKISIDANNLKRIENMKANKDGGTLPFKSKNIIAALVGMSIPTDGFINITVNGKTYKVEEDFDIESYKNKDPEFYNDYKFAKINNQPIGITKTNGVPIVNNLDRSTGTPDINSKGPNGITIDPSNNTPPGNNYDKVIPKGTLIDNVGDSPSIYDNLSKSKVLLNPYQIEDLIKIDTSNNTPNIAPTSDNISKALDDEKDKKDKKKYTNPFNRAVDTMSSSGSLTPFIIDLSAGIATQMLPDGSDQLEEAYKKKYKSTFTPRRSMLLNVPNIIGLSESERQAMRPKKPTINLTSDINSNMVQQHLASIEDNNASIKEAVMNQSKVEKTTAIADNIEAKNISIVNADNEFNRGSLQQRQDNEQIVRAARDSAYLTEKGELERAKSKRWGDIFAVGSKNLKDYAVGDAYSSDYNATIKELNATNASYGKRLDALDGTDSKTFYNRWAKYSKESDPTKKAKYKQEAMNVLI